MKKIMVVCCFILVVTNLVGCSAFKSHDQSVSISCVDQDIVLMVNGQITKCPTQLNLPRNRDFSVQANKSGCFPYNRSIGHHFNTTGTLDAIGTLLILVPGIGLLTPGAWDLDETSLTISMVQMGQLGQGK
jgi:hypothetical protein